MKVLFTGLVLLHSLSSFAFTQKIVQCDKDFFEVTPYAQHFGTEKASNSNKKLYFRHYSNGILRKDQGVVAGYPKVKVKEDENIISITAKRSEWAVDIITLYAGEVLTLKYDKKTKLVSFDLYEHWNKIPFSIEFDEAIKNCKLLESLPFSRKNTENYFRWLEKEEIQENK